MNWKIVIPLVLGLSIGASALAAAAPATNDDIAGAIKLEEGAEQRFTTVEATVEGSEELCAGGNTVWFSFGTQTPGRFVAYATGSDHDSEVGWNDSLTNSTGACPDDSSDSSDAVEEIRILGASEQEFVQVGAHTIGNVGTGSVGVVEIQAAADDFGDAVDLLRRPDAVNAVAGIEFLGIGPPEGGEPDTCGGSSLSPKSAWLNFVAPESGSWMFESKSVSETDIGVYSGDAVDTLILLDCATTDRSAVIIDVTEGETYRVRIAGDDVTEPVVVRAEFAPIPMTASLVDANGSGGSGNVGTVSDIAIVDGQPAIAYYDADNRELRWAERAANGTWTDTRIDANGDGTSTDVGRTLALAVLNDGRPVVAYYDADNRELRWAERATNGTWTDTRIDANGDGTSTDVGSQLSVAIRANGRPAVAYYDADNDELRLASRAGNGTWSDSRIDADGDGTSTDVGRSPGLVEFASGDLGVSYVDTDNSQLRFATRTAGVWTDELIYDDSAGNTLVATETVLDALGEPVVAVADADQGNHLLAWRDGTEWTLEWDRADRHIAERDRGCARPALLLDGGSVFILWTDCNRAGTFALSLRKPGGEWTAEDIVPAFQQPQDEAYNGSDAVWDTTDFGAAWLPDGRMAVSVHYDGDDALWYAEDALVAEAGPDVGSPTATSATFDGSASDDAWGAISFMQWSDPPPGCTLVDDDTTTPSISCLADTTGTVTLTVFDTDDFSHSDTAGFQVAAPIVTPSCDTTPDPFVDVSSTSFARAEITCIFNLGVTNGTSPTTYAPADLVTREQIAAFLARLYESMTGSAAPIVGTPFTDVSNTSFAKDSIARIYGLGITTGTGPTTYAPDGLVTREQMAAFLARLYLAG